MSRDIDVGPIKNVKASLVDEQVPALYLIVEPGGQPGDVLTLRALRDIIEAAGIRDWFVDQEQVQLLRREQTTLKAPKMYRIAECRQAQVRVEIASDRNVARLTIVPPCGGEPVTAEKILEALKKAGVTFGILEKKIPGLVERGAVENEIIAEASPSIAGTDAHFERLFKESEHKGQPKIDDTGKVDLHDLGLFISVVKGTPLLRKIPPSPGIPGIAVDGSPIPFKKPRDQSLIAGPGTVLSHEDPNILIASADGLPVFEENSAKIVSKLELDGLDYETGNVEFVGSVNIRGAIQAGFVAKTGGDISVEETVDASDLTADGAINLRCGIFGRGRSRITAKGSIRARFLSDCDVYCGGNLEVDDLISNCTVICEGSVEVGQRWGKGQIYGGRILATKGVRAKILGSVVETSTAIEVSSSPKLAARERIVTKEIGDTEQKAEDLSRSLSYLESSATPKKDPRMGRLRRDLQLVRAKLNVLKREQSELTEKLQVRSDAKIIASEVHPGVTISIGKRKEIISSTLGHSVFESIEESSPPSSSATENEARVSPSRSRAS